jgi:hypothetical protein
MGNCVYCGEKAGLFKSVHPECEERHNQGIGKIKELPLLYNINEPFGQTIETSKQIATECFINEQTRSKALVDGIGTLVEKYLDDGVISLDEEKTMSAIVTSMDYDFSEINSKVQKGIVLRNLTEGIIPNVQLDQCPINLEKDEKIVYAFGGVVFYEMAEERHYEGGSSGLSVRIAKGLYYRTSAFKGYPVISNTLKQKGIGILFITNKNVYFYSETKSEKIPLKKIIATTNYNDGIGIQKDGKTAKPAVFKMAAHSDDGWFVCNIVSNLLEIIKGK